MTYPVVMSEDQTIAWAHAGKSLARFGDGELRIAIGGDSISQKRDENLRRELRAILAGEYGKHILPCIPNMRPEMPRQSYFKPYADIRYTSLYKAGAFGSVFVSRPECAPWIDRPDYWARVSDFWRGKSVAYVSGDDRLLRVMKGEAASIDVIPAPKRDAYSVISDLERTILKRPYDRVIIALGAAGTALAARLGRMGAQHALDLGHIGHFMLQPGAYALNPDELASPEYRALLQHQHKVTHWGKGGHSWADKIKAYADKLGVVQCLDYGCGSGTLKPALAALGLKCNEYDPGIPGKDIPPKLAELVISTDVFEHIEPEKVDAVLLHTFRLASRAGFFAIAKQPAKAILADNRNAHLTCQPTVWWVQRLREAGWSRVKVVEDAWKKCLIICEK